MTTRADLLRLADRVEREEPSDDLNWCIGQTQPVTPGKPRWLDYTTSRDAAASLMPTTVLEVTVRNYQTGTYVRATTQAGKPVYSEMLSRGGPCEPRARTAAALRAMAQEMKDE